ncbi:unnamed protein product, partial [Ilex paraguariensis]
MIFNEELRHFSKNCAKDCDKAFRSSLIEDDSVGGSLTDGERKRRESTPFSLALDSPTVTTPATEASCASWHSRPLPKLPPEEVSKRGLATTSYESDYGLNSSDERDDDAEIIGEATRLVMPVLIPKQGDRRVASAPAYSQATRKLSTLPSINENAGIQPTANNDGTRIVSAPPHGSATRGREKDHGMEYLSKVEKSIRVVHSPGAQSPVKAPQPLNIRKKSTAEDFGRKLQRQLAYHADEHHDDAAEPPPQEANGPVKKKKSWFKRSSRPESEPNATEAPSATWATAPRQTTLPDADSTGEAAKKRAF